MLGEIAASGTALAWGAADFCGGKGSRGAGARAVVVVSQLAGVPLLVGALWLTADTWPSAADVGWGFLAGLSGGVGLLLLYRALAAGAMSLVAPITGVTAAALPLVLGLVVDRTPGALAVVGAVVAVVAIALVSAMPATRSRLSGPLLGLSLASGLGYGLFYALLEPVGEDAGLWPLVGIRVGTLVTAVVLALRGGSPRLTAPAARWAVGAGVLDVIANACFLVASHDGALSVVGPIASLYPVCTVLLAVAVDQEVLRPPQFAALGLAAAALVLTHLG
ncbi:EamA family transporter [Saccharothrix obliqua]|uniref:EamA family transporter n=1 Tax=Saccharothrix obliqua TaxID=2861747 RepID=UPI001C5D672D|nr:EamA family transporter [Saccharothrix obliqua]MBW4721907.1 EamA family transporter [Saccharothrix obliqua]